jgi:methyltransferase (TIGR00027 family)
MVALPGGRDRLAKMKENDNPTVGHVSDTALIVAVYRAEEGERPDALFRDPLARRLAGERGFRMARHMSRKHYIRWALSVRTVVIDRMIAELLADGVDTIVNLGAGLDTRPYRLELPHSLKWFEIDFPHMIQYKNQRLADEKPHCQLTRIALDLTDSNTLSRELASINSTAKKVLVITEGVTLYLTADQVGDLATNLRTKTNFIFWINDYFSPRVLKVLGRRRIRDLKNAPFQFVPADWFAFFAKAGWKARQIKYLVDESLRIGRRIPVPWWARILMWISPPARREEFRRSLAYVVFGREA